MEIVCLSTFGSLPWSQCSDCCQGIVFLDGYGFYGTWINVYWDTVVSVAVGPMSHFLQGKGKKN